ncbi:MAG: hypothetical protein JWQ11_3580 [Rhizobacter sp.]|nr:hypothetical protein [Rhizobacter sp.]
MATPVWLWVAAASVIVVLALWLLALFRMPKKRPPSQRPSFDDLDTVSAWQPQPTRVLGVHQRVAHATAVRAVPELLVFAQVPLARFLKVPTRYSYNEWLRRVGHQSADLLVCDASTEVIAVIDVRSPKETSSARTEQRRRRLVKVLKAARIPLHVWVTDALPTVEMARASLMPHLPQDDPNALPRATRSNRRRDASLHVPTRPFSDSETHDLSPDEVIEMREPHSSSWFDNLDSRGVPLKPLADDADSAPSRPREPN